jgi:hypothetical protein
MENLVDKIYKKQFFEYDYDNGCEKAREVLEALQTLDTNPLLLQYVLKCLKDKNIEQKPYYYIVVKQEYRGDVIETAVNKVFESVTEAEHYATYGKFPYSILFEPYIIKCTEQ